MAFTHREDGFLAPRPFLYYFVLAATTGQGFYDLTVTDCEAGGLDVSLYMSRRNSSEVSQPRGGEGASVTTIPGNATPIQSPAAYLSFWRRLGYFLSLEDTWYICDKIKAVRESRDDLLGHTDNICGIGFHDNLPPGYQE